MPSGKPERRPALNTKRAPPAPAPGLQGGALTREGAEQGLLKEAECLCPQLLSCVAYKALPRGGRSGISALNFCFYPDLFFFTCCLSEALTSPFLRDGEGRGNRPDFLVLSIGNHLKTLRLLSCLPS